MRKDFGRKTHCNPFHTLCQQKRKLDRQCNRFALSPIIGKLPLGRLRIEDYFQGKLGKSSFNVSSSGGTVTGTHITPIALSLDEKVFLTQVHYRISNRGVTVRVVLHGLTDDVRDLVKSTIIHLLHRVKNPTLHRLQAVFDRRNSALKDYIGSIIQKPVFVHPCHWNRVMQAFFFAVSQVSIVAHLLSQTNIFKSNCKNQAASISSSSSAFLGSSSAKSFSILKLSMMKFCRSGVFFPM